MDRVTRLTGWLRAMVESPVDVTRLVANAISTQIASVMIARLWRDTHTYIYAAPTEDCEADRRGPQDTKYCRPGDPNVYYAYMIPDSMEMSMVPWVSVRKPEGYDRLDAFGQDITLNMAMESSIGAFYSTLPDDPFSYDEEDSLNSLTSLFRPGSVEEGGEKGGDDDDDDVAMGFASFRLPVCFDPTGTQFVPEDKIWADETPLWAPGTKFGTSFPCRCGPGGAHTEAFRRYSGLDRVAKYKNWCRLPGSQGPQGGGEDDELEVPDVWKGGVGGG